MAPKMFSQNKPKKKIRTVFIIANLETGERFVSPQSPDHFEIKCSAEYTIEFMQIPEYSVVEVEYDPENKSYSF